VDAAAPTGEPLPVNAVQTPDDGTGGTSLKEVFLKRMLETMELVDNNMKAQVEEMKERMDAQVEEMNITRS